MIFNFNEKLSIRPSDDPKIFYLPPDSDFVNDFVDGFLAKFEPQALDLNPEILGKVIILASNKKLAKQIEALLENRGFIILPKIIELENLEEVFHQQPTMKVQGIFGFNQYKTISKLEKFLFLNNIIQETQEHSFEKRTKTTSFDLAQSLASLIEELNINNLNSVNLKKLTDEELPKHLQLNLGLLQKVMKRYERILIEEKLIDENTNYLFEVDELINAWKSNPFSKPIVLVGSTGSQLATAKLMKAVTQLPQGLVVLPGLDPYLTDRAWNSLTPDHPQYGFLALSKIWGLEGSQRNKIIKAPPWHNLSMTDESSNSIRIRSQLFSLLMRPGPVTDEWRTEGALIANELTFAMNSVSLIEAENLRQEATSICVGMKEAVDRGSTVALITPSKVLARLVTVELQRWNISPNNSLGISLGSSDFGVFCRQGALVLEKDFPLNAVISLLQNHYCGGDYFRHDFNLSKIQETFSNSDKSFFDLVIGDWVLAQDEEFIGWFNWLLEVFREASCEIKPDFLENIFSVHKNFLQRLMKGYVPQHSDYKASGEIKFSAKTGDSSQVFSLLNRELKVSLKSGQYEFWVYRKIIENLLIETTYVPEIENRRSNIFIWGTLESRMQYADVFILGGLNEGIWPSYYNDDLWLNRSMRAVVGIDLLERKVGLSAHDFQQAAMAKTLILSRSLRDNNGLTIASRWLTRLESLLGGLGQEGKKCLIDIRSRGLTLSKLALNLYSSDLQINQLTTEVKCKAVRPAPVPPLSARPNKLSITEIETLIKNPYAIYAKRVLNLKKIENFKYSGDPRNKGTLMHAAMENFVTETTDDFARHNNLCDLLSEKFNTVLENAEVPIQFRSLWKAQFDTRIKNIITLEKRRRANGKPVALEITGTYRIKLKVNEVFLISGKVDRIDKGPDGFTIYDYKTGQISKKDLETFSSQLDIEALMLAKGSFATRFDRDGLFVSLIGLGSEPKQYQKVVTEENLECWNKGLIDIIKKMKLELSAFVARALPSQLTFVDDYQHLSRFGEWNDNDDYNETILVLPAIRVVDP